MSTKLTKIQKEWVDIMKSHTDSYVLSSPYYAFQEVKSRNHNHIGFMTKPTLQALKNKGYVEYVNMSYRLTEIKREESMIELKRGQIAVSKKDLLELIAVMRRIEIRIDSIMTEPESFELGKKVALELNRLTLARHQFEHFQLNIPLKKLK